MVDFVFVYEVKARELDNICLVAAELEKNGYSVEIINSWHLELKPIYKRLSCRVIVLPACYKDDTYQYFTSFVKSFEKVVNFQWEQVIIPSYDTTTETSSFAFSGKAKEVIHVCWGEKTVSRLTNNYGIDKNKLPVVGNLSLDFYTERLQSCLPKREDIFSKHSINTDLKTMLFISSFNIISLPKSLLAKDVDDTNGLALRLYAQSQNEILEYFKKFLSENNDTQIIYRPHPTEAKNSNLMLLQEQLDNFYCIPEGTIKEWINACDKVITWVSTGVVEAFAAKKHTIILRPYDMDYRRDIPYYANAEITKSYETFKAAATAEDNIFPINEQELLSYYDISEQPTYKRLFKVLEECYNSKEYSSSKLPLYNSFILYKLSKFIYRFTYYSTFNRFLIWLAKKYDFNVEFMTRRKALNFNEMKAEYRYFKSRRDINYASKKKIRTIINEYKKFI